jgi:hypothetical protein
VFLVGGPANDARSEQLIAACGPGRILDLNDRKGVTLAVTLIAVQ